MIVTEKRLVSTFTFLGSIASYYYSKAHQKDVVPYIMIGGFVGAIIGEVIAKAAIPQTEKKENEYDNDNK